MSERLEEQLLRQESYFNARFLRELDSPTAERGIMRNSENVSLINQNFDPKQCPFAPAISNNSRILMVHKRVQPLEDRFPGILKEKKNKLEEARRLREDEELKEVQDFVHIRRQKQEKTLGASAKPRDVYKENKAWHERKLSKINEQIADKLESEINDQNLTFKPRVNQNRRIE